MIMVFNMVILLTLSLTRTQRTNNHGVTNGLPNPRIVLVDSRDPKNVAIKHYFLALNAQAIGLTECNVHWKKIPAFARLHERTMGWFEALGVITAYYEKYEAGSPFQPGGVSL